MGGPVLLYRCCWAVSCNEGVFFYIQRKFAVKSSRLSSRSDCVQDDRQIQKYASWLSVTRGIPCAAGVVSGLPQRCKELEGWGDSYRSSRQHIL